MTRADPLARRLARELRWHEEHPDSGELETISRYKLLILARMRARQWAMLGDLTGKRVLEIGCGVGRETVELARRGARVVATDLSPTLVEVTRSRVAAAGLADRVTFEVGAAEQLAAGGRRFDVVVGNGVLHHLDLAAIKPKLVELLGRHGFAQFAEPLIHNPLLRLYRALTAHMHTPEERPLSEAVIAQFVDGFADVRIEYFNLLGLFLLPAPYVAGNLIARRMLAATATVDAALLRRVGGLCRYCQYVVIQVGAPVAQGVLRACADSWSR